MLTIIIAEKRGGFTIYAAYARDAEEEVAPVRRDAEPDGDYAPVARDAEIDGKLESSLRILEDANSLLLQRRGVVLPFMRRMLGTRRRLRKSDHRSYVRRGVASRWSILYLRSPLSLEYITRSF